MDKLKTIVNAANKQTNLGFGLVALLTAGGEQIFSNVIFECPCNHLNFIYGMVFLLVPALALLTMGIILSKKTWKLVTGLCHRKEKVCGNCNQARSLAKALFHISSMVIVAPGTWMAVSLLNGVYIECAMTGTNMTLFNDHLCKGLETEKQCMEKLHTFPCREDGKDVLLTLKVESQVLGWLLIASIVLSYLVLTCVMRCTSPVSYLQLKFWWLYAREERSALEKQSAEHAQELAKRNVKSFFSNDKPKDIQTPSQEDWEKLSSLYKYRSKKGKHFYSNLHCFAETRSHGDVDKRNHSLKSTGSYHETAVDIDSFDDIEGPIELGNML